MNHRTIGVAGRLQLPTVRTAPVWLSAQGGGLRVVLGEITGGRARASGRCLQSFYPGCDTGHGLHSNGFSDTHLPSTNDHIIEPESLLYTRCSGQ